MTFWPPSSQPSPYHHHHYHHITITTITTVHIDRGVKLLKDAPTEESGIPNLLYVDFYDSELQGVRSVGGGLKNSSCLNPFAECYHSFSATLLNPMNSWIQMKNWIRTSGNATTPNIYQISPAMFTLEQQKYQWCEKQWCAVKYSKCTKCNCTKGDKVKLKKSAKIMEHPSSEASNLRTHLKTHSGEKPNKSH